MQLSKVFLDKSKGIKPDATFRTPAFMKAQFNLHSAIYRKADAGEVQLLTHTTALEGDGYNLRPWLNREGFAVIDRPNKRVLILWNC